MQIMSLFSKANRRQKSGAVVSVGVTPEGVSVASVARAEGVSPLLELCDFREAADEQERRTALKALTRDYGLDQGTCCSVMEPDAYSLLLVEAPDVPRDELKAAMRWRIKDLIDFHIDDAVVDVFDVPDQKRATASRLMYVVAAKAKVVRERVDLLESAGLSLSAIDVPELALRNLAALLPEDVAGMALVHLTGDSGLIVLTHQATLYLARRFPSALATLESAWSSHSGGVGDGWPSGVRDVLDGLVVEVQRSLDYYDSHFSQAPIRHLVVAPMAVQVPGMTDYLARQLGLSARMIDLNTVIDSGNVIDVDLQARCTPIIGEALRVEEKAL